MPVVYSARAKSEPTVATPLTWEEVEAGIEPKDFTILNMKKRIQEMGDLYRVDWVRCGKWCCNLLVD